MRASISVSFNINASIVFLIDIAILSCFFGRVFHGWTALRAWCAVASLRRGGRSPSTLSEARTGQRRGPGVGGGQ